MNQSNKSIYALPMLAMVGRKKTDVPQVKKDSRYKLELFQFVTYTAPN